MVVMTNPFAKAFAAMAWENVSLGVIVLKFISLTALTAVYANKHSNTVLTKNLLKIRRFFVIVVQTSLFTLRCTGCFTLRLEVVNYLRIGWIEFFGFGKIIHGLGVIIVLIFRIVSKISISIRRI